jgi:hypothetical protein
MDMNKKHLEKDPGEMQNIKMKDMIINRDNMKIVRIVWLPICLFTVSMFFSSCQSPDQKVTTANENLAEAKTNLAKAQQDSSNAYNDSVADYEASKTKWEAEISANEKDLAEYKAEIASENDQQRINHEKRMNDMEIANNNLKITIADYKEDGKESWQKFKIQLNKDAKDFKEDMADLGRSINHLTSKKDTN